jgi:hypothetical protein
MKVLEINLEEVTMERDELRKQAQLGGAPAEAVEETRRMYRNRNRQRSPFTEKVWG